MDESGISFPLGAWTWVGRCMVVVLLAHCLKSMVELGVDNKNASVAFDSEMNHATVDCLPAASRSLWEPLRQECVKYKNSRE